MRLVLAGDSHLTDVSPCRAVVKLGPRLRALGFDVVTVAVAGANSRGILDQQIPGDADWVVYSVRVNDAAPWKRVPLDEFRTNCDRLLSGTGQPAALVLGPGPVVERGLSGERTNAAIAEYSRVLEELAVAYRRRFVAMSKSLALSDLAEDGVHLNDAGYSKLAAYVVGEVQPVSGESVVLPTERHGMLLRLLTAADSEAYYEIVDRNRLHLTQHGDYAFVHDVTLEEVKADFEQPSDNNVRLGIWLDEQLVGRVDLNPVNRPRWVIGYWIDQDVTGEGVATIACRAAIAYAQTLGATEIYAGITNGNAASVGVVRRLGFELIQDVETRTRWRLALVENPPPPVMV